MILHLNPSFPLKYREKESKSHGVDDYILGFIAYFPR
jgi:hypothetical protein